MANTGYAGIDVRQTSSRLVFVQELADASGTDLTSGTTSVYLYEVQDDGTLKSYDWNDNTFKTGTLTTETSAATHRTGNNGATNTALWTKVLTTLTGFTVGGVYVVVFANPQSSPPSVRRVFQFGGAEGDPLVVYGKVSDAGAAAGDFDAASGLSSSDDFYNGAVLVFLSGTLQGISRKVSDYVGSSRNFAFSGSTGDADAPFPAAPANGDSFAVLGRIG